jgi:competence protein ComFC
VGVLDKLLDLLFPPRCAFCHTLLGPEDSGGMCKKCEKDLPYTSGSDINQKVQFLSGCAAPLYYEGDVRESLLRYKFGQCTGYAGVYAPLVAECAAENLGGFDVISWVPLSRMRLRKRGYDQAYLLAAAVGKALDMPVRPLLVKTRNARPQSGTGGAEKRRANISGAYSVPGSAAVSGLRVLLIDDIVTTGSTLSECARTLLTAGAESVCAAAVARHRD